METCSSSVGSPQGGSLKERIKRIFGGREIWAVADQGLVSGTSFLTNLLVGRFLGIAQFGVFALSWTAMLFFYSMQMALICGPMMSIGPKTPLEDRRSYWGAVILQQSLYVLTSSALIFLGQRFIATLSKHEDLQQLTYPLCLATFSYLTQDFVRRYLFTTRQSHRALLNDAVSCLPQLPLIFLFLRLRLIGVGGVLWIIAGTSLVGVALGFYWLEEFVVARQSVKNVAARHWQISKWTAPSWLLSWVSTNFMALLAPVYYGPAAAGALRACQNIVAVTHIWILGLDNVLPAEAAHRFHAAGCSALSAYLRSMSLRWGSVTCGFALLIGAAPLFWLRHLYGTQFIGYGWILRMYCLLYIIIFIGGPARAGLQALEYTAPFIWAQLAASAFALGVGVPLTRTFGLDGVMVGTISTMLILQTTLLVSLQRRLAAVSS